MLLKWNHGVRSGTQLFSMLLLFESAKRKFCLSKKPNCNPFEESHLLARQSVVPISSQIYKQSWNRNENQASRRLMAIHFETC